MGGSPEIGSSRPAWPTCWNLISTKNTKIQLVWWHMSVFLATWEAEAGELLEPGRRRLQWAEIMPLHFRLGNRMRLFKKKISQAWWRSPVISATQEAVAGELLEPRRQRLQWAKIEALLPSSLSGRARPCLKKEISASPSQHHWIRISRGWTRKLHFSDAPDCPHNYRRPGNPALE